MSSVFETKHGGESDFANCFGCDRVGRLVTPVLIKLVKIGKNTCVSKNR